MDVFTHAGQFDIFTGVLTAHYALCGECCLWVECDLRRIRE